jgi:hypothetical protein
VYSYRIIPYNAIDAAGTTITTTNISPTPSATFGTISVTSYSISMTFFGANTYYNVTIARLVSGVYGTYTTLGAGVTSYNDPSNAFFANTTYQYSILPYNAIGTVGTELLSPIVSPPATVVVNPIAITATTSSFSFVSTTTFYSVNVAPVINGVIGTYSGVAPGTAVYVDPGASFSTWNSYSYSIIPFNAVGGQGTTYTIPSAVSPIPTFNASNIGPIFVSATCISFNLLNAATYNTVSIARVINGTIGMYIAVPKGTTTYIDPSNAFLPSFAYSYSIIPYNVLGGNGVTYLSSSVSPPALAVAVGTPTVTTTAISFPLINTMNYYQVYASRTDNGVTGPYFSSPPYAANFTDPSNSFYASRTYSYTIIPYNAVGTPNNALTITTPTVSPPATVTIGVTSANYVDISFNFLNMYTFSSINLAPITGGVLGTYTGIYVPASSLYIDPRISFQWGIYYNYSIIPYNALGAQGTTLVTTPTMPPLIGITSPNAVRFLQVIDNTRILAYYPFDYVNGSAPYFTPSYEAVVDICNIRMYYPFDT